MARNILAQLVVALRDEVSGRAKQVADSLKNVKKAADDLGKAGGGSSGLNNLSSSLGKAAQEARRLAAEGVKLADWGSRFNAQLARLKATPSEIAAIRNAFQQLNREMANLGAADRGRALQNFRNSALSHLLEVRAAARQTDQAINRIGRDVPMAGLRRLRSELSLLTQTLGFGTATFAGQRGVRAGTRYSAESVREPLRQQFAGIRPGDRAELAAQSRVLSQKYPSLTPVEIQEQGRLMFPNVGMDPSKVRALLPVFTQAQTALQTIRGEGHDAKDMAAFSRFTDIIERSLDVNAVQQMLDGFVRYLALDPEAIKGSDFFQAAQTSAAAGKSLSPEFWAKVFPALAMQSGGFRSGTDIATAFQNMAIGRAGRIELQNQQNFGLRTGLKIGRMGRIEARGTLVDEELYMTNPYEWGKKHLVPRLVAEGHLPEGWARGDFSQDTTPEQRANVTKRLSELFSHRRGANLFSMFIAGMDQMEKTMAAAFGPDAPGMKFADEAQQKDPFVAIKSIGSQLKELFSAMTDPALTAAAPILHSIAQSLGSMAEGLRNSPDVAANLALVATGVLGLAAAAKTAAGVFALIGLARGAGAAGAAIAGGAGVGAAAAAGAGAAAGSLPTIARAGLMGGRFIPGVGLVLGAGALAHGIYSGQNDPKAGDAEDRAAALGAVGRRLRGAAGSAPDLRETGRQAGETYKQGLSEANVDGVELPKPTAPDMSQEGAQAVKSFGDGIRANEGQAVQAAQGVMDRLKAIFSSPLRPNIQVPAAPGAAPTAVGRSSGGFMSAGRAYKVGEQGEELVMLGQNGRAYPIDRRAAPGGRGVRGGMSPTINIPITISGVAMGVEELVGAIEERLETSLRAGMRAIYSDYGIEEPG